MTKTEIIAALQTNENEIISLFNSVCPSLWTTHIPNKWSAGQHIMHLVQSTQPLINALRLPKFFLTYKFGKSNRTVRSYDEIIDKYNSKLATAPEGISSPFSKNMPDATLQNKDVWLTKMSELNKKLNSKISTISDQNLDTIVLPHPLMGKMILRELLMWNAYHTKHHHKVLLEKYT